MSAVQVVEADQPAIDPLVARLGGLLAELGGAVADCTPASDAARIDRIRTITVTTPTGHRYHSRAPDPP